MSIKEIRESEAYKKIEAYRTGFKWRMDYTKIPKKYHIGLQTVLDQARKDKLIVCNKTCFSIDLELTDEEWERI